MRSPIPLFGAAVVLLLAAHAYVVPFTFDVVDKTIPESGSTLVLPDMGMGAAGWVRRQR